ncbi:hypothetical protein ACFPOB_05275 [Bosea eneae]|uniref:Uncharacterized protein n=1 Tax=Bosea eneae TaxID=151454 RepID=A0ABW0IPC4_9HYPH
MHSRRRLSLALAGLGLATIAALPAAAATLRVHLNADIRSINPGVNRDDNTDAVMLHVVEGLVAYGEDSEVKPLLAEKVEVSPDGLRVRPGTHDARAMRRIRTMAAAA